MSVVSISLPDALLDQVDILVKRRGYSGRSEVMRAAIRDFAARELQEPVREGQRAATLTIVYPEGRERHIGEIRHTFNEIVKSMVHAHTGANCVEVFMLQGRAERVREFVHRLKAYRETRLVQEIYTDVPPQEE